ncbi:hypothetical protein [Nocardioides sp.]|uniref:hypothetical protein n=1 Tax=Nocardioides sp. TaxID=35761 RepID=UPI002ED37265
MTERAWGWVAHLREGGTTRWRDWTGSGPATGPVLPGAQQLELLRRANLVGRPSAVLAGRILAVDPPRRARPGLPLVDGPPVPDHGPRPVDPTTVPDTELTRLAAVLLAEEVAGHTPSPPRRGRLRPWRVRYHLLGDPEHVEPWRRHLIARGRPPGGYGGRVVVVGTDTGRMLVDLWSAHCFRHGAVPWPQWLARRVSRGDLPGPLDLDALARREQDRPEPNRVHVVTDPALVGRLVGVRRGPGLPQPMAASAVDLGRRVCAVLRPLAAPEDRARLITDVLRPVLADAPGLPLAVPSAHRAWVRSEAERLHRQLGRGRYPVHGDAGLVLPVDRAGVENPDVAETLALALRLLLSAALTPTPEEGS